MKTRTNREHIKELIIKIKDETIRYKIVFLDTKIGSYIARKLKPENFIRGRQVSGSVYEAKEIAKQRERTLESVDKHSPEEVLKELKELQKNASKLTNLVKESELSEKLDQLEGAEEIAGKSLEEELIKMEKIKTKGKPKDYLEQATLYKEASKMSSELSDLIENLKN